MPGGRVGARRAGAVAVLAAVLALHALLLERLPPGESRRLVARPDRATAPALQVRQLSPNDAATPAAPGKTSPQPPAPASVARPTVSTSAKATPTPREEVTRGAAAVAPPDSAAYSPSSGPRATPSGTAPPPRYATRLPPAATLQFAVTRAQRDGTGLQAELRWRPEPEGYTLTLGFEAAGWASVGVLDIDGLAPVRHVETRRGREVRAANFHRDAGADGSRITFSGPAVEHPLWPGAQDRLSWLMQLPAVLQADPGLARPGAEVQLFVAGVRGDALWWHFVVQSVEPVELATQEVVTAVHLQRLPQHSWDTRVDVWLDPARHHLPVRLQIRNGAAATTEFRLLGLSLP